MKLSRFSEPSTWAGMGILFGVLSQAFQVINPDLSHIFGAITGGAGGVAIWLRENGGGK